MKYELRNNDAIQLLSKGAKVLHAQCSFSWGRTVIVYPYYDLLFPMLLSEVNTHVGSFPKQHAAININWFLLLKIPKKLFPSWNFWIITQQKEKYITIAAQRGVADDSWPKGSLKGQSETVLGDWRWPAGGHRGQLFFSCLFSSFSATLPRLQGKGGNQ